MHVGAILETCCETRISSYLFTRYYACWVGKFYFKIRQPTTTISPKSLICSTLDPKNKFPKVV